MRYGIANRAGHPSEAEVKRIVELAVSAGVTTLDTARAYGDSERVIGRLTSAMDTFRVITKLAPDMDAEVATSADAVPKVQDTIDRSRTSLGRDHLNTVLLHRTRHRHMAGGACGRRCAICSATGSLANWGYQPEHRKKCFRPSKIRMCICTCLRHCFYQRMGACAGLP